MTAADPWKGLRAGDQIGNLEYVVDEAALAEYRRAVGTSGCFPNLMAEDCRALLSKHEPWTSLSTVWQRLDFLRPPILGRRVQVGGWVREIRLKRRPPWIKAAAFAVDEIGTEILRSEAAFAVGQTGAQSAPIVERSEAKPEAVNLAGSRAGDGGLLGELCLPALPCRHGYPLVAHEIAEIEMPPDGNGLTSITAGWLESLMGANFGDDFRWGGRLSISYHRAATPGMELRCEGVTLGHDTDARGVEKRHVAMSVRDAGGYRVATANAVIKSPSPRLV